MASKGTAVPSSGSAGWLESLGTLPDAPILFYGRPILRQSWSEGKQELYMIQSIQNTSPPQSDPEETHEEDTKATWLELFYDLVVCISKIGMFFSILNPNEH